MREAVSAEGANQQPVAVVYGRGKLLSISEDDGVIWETDVLDCIQSVSCTAVEPPDLVSSTNAIVDVCALIPGLNYVVTAGFSYTMCVWDVSSGSLVTSIESTQPSFTALEAYKVTDTDTGGYGRTRYRILSGHRSGHALFYDLKICDDVRVAVKGEKTGRSVTAVGDGPQERVTVPADHLSGSAYSEQAVETPSSDDVSAGPVRGAPDSRGSSHVVVTDCHLYRPAPLVDIFISKRGHCIALCHSRLLITVHDVRLCKASLQLQLADDVVDVSAVSHAISRDDDDELQLAIQSAQGAVKVLDCLTGSTLWSVTPPVDAPLSSAFPSQTNSKIIFTLTYHYGYRTSSRKVTSRKGHVSSKSDGSGQYFVLSVTADGEVLCSADSGSGGRGSLTSLCHVGNHPHLDPRHFSALDKLVYGAKLFGSGGAFIAAIWCCRLLTVMLFQGKARTEGKDQEDASTEALVIRDSPSAQNTPKRANKLLGDRAARIASPSPPPSIVPLQEA
eukprot:gene5118-6516_t